MRMSRALCFGFMAAACRFALAQPGIPGWNIEVIGGPVSPSNPSVTVRVSARFSHSDHAFAAGHFDIIADEAGWSNPRVILPPPSAVGVISDSSVLDIQMGQLNWHPQWPNTSNPLQVWEAQWTPSSLRPRLVNIVTQTYRFDVYPRPKLPGSESRMQGLTEGVGQITVIPAPATGVLLAGAGVIVAGSGRPRRIQQDRRGEPRCA